MVDALGSGLPGLRTTHDWSAIVDEQHIDTVREQASRQPVDPTHLVLEVLAYAVDEAVEGVGRHVWVELHDDGSVSVTDDGRGTDTRPDAAGRAVVKPVMGTPDLRFHGRSDAPVLVDGTARAGLSTVCAVSTWLEHVNRRATGAWARRYEGGRPAGPARHVAADGTTGTSVRFLPDADLVAGRVDGTRLRRFTTELSVPVDVVD